MALKDGRSREIREEAEGFERFAFLPLSLSPITR